MGELKAYKQSKSIWLNSIQYKLSFRSESIASLFTDHFSPRPPQTRRHYLSLMKWTPSNSQSRPWNLSPLTCFNDALDGCQAKLAKDGGPGDRVKLQIYK